jgi:scyllo-inositol 2-dehydrogenase (NADP+)
MEPVAVGIVGLGRSGWDIHAAALAGRDDYRVAAVADPLEERRAEAAERFGCRTCAGYQELLAEEGVELVVVAAPSWLHAPVALAAVEAGRHVLVEKPFALTRREGEQVLDAAAAAGRVVTCFQNRRFDPDYLLLREIIDSGVLGEVFFIRLGHYGFARRADWQTLRHLGGGILHNWGPHVLDLALLLLGDLEPQVHAQLRRVASAGDAEDHARVTLRARSGREVEVELAMYALPLPQWTVMGTAGSLSGDGKAFHLKYYDPAAVPPLVASDGPAPDRRYGTGEVLPWQEEVRKVPGGASLAGQYYTALLPVVRGEAPPFVTREELLAQLRVQDMARAAA